MIYTKFRRRYPDGSRARHGEVVKGEVGDVGERQGSEGGSVEAAEGLSRFPIAVQLRYLQTMREVASERNTTTFFPLPLDLFAPLLRAFSAAEPPKS